ncbi:MAG TPA: DUF6582 domain-containing protein [Herpetosiphonaceae bacterium]
MATLSEKERDELPDCAFAYIDKDGGRHLPIHDEDHARNAIARYPQTNFESKAAKERSRKHILEAAKKFGIDVSEDAEISQRAD